MLNFTQTGQEIRKVWQKIIYSLKYDFHCSNSRATHIHLTFHTKFHENLTKFTVSRTNTLSLRGAFLFYSEKNASKQLNLQQSRKLDSQ